MGLTIGTIPVFDDMPDTVFSSNQPLKASKFLQLSHNAKYAAVRSETIYLGFFTNGNIVPLPVSPVDGYEYSQSEVQFSARLYSTRQPGAGFTPGQKTPPSSLIAPTISPSALWGIALNAGNLYYFAADVDDSTGTVSVLQSNYVQGGAETVTYPGTVKVYALCQRGDVTVHGAAIPTNVPATLTPPTSWSLSADLAGNLILSFPVPAGVDYRFVQLGLLADLEKNRNYPASPGLTQLTAGVTAYASWAASTAYSSGAYIVDAAGHLQKCTTAGTSGSAIPSFNDSGGTTADGTAVWTDQGYDSITVASSSGFYVGDLVGLAAEVVEITGPGTAGSAPTSNTWNVARAQALTPAGTAVTNDFVYRLVPVILNAAIAPGYTLDNPTGSGPTAINFTVSFRPGRMRILYASLQLWNDDQTTAQLEQSLDTFSYEPIVPNTLPGLRVADGTYGLIEVFGTLSVGSSVASPVLVKFNGTIGLLYATIGTPPTGSAIVGQLQIQAPQIGDGVSFYNIGDAFTIPAGDSSTQVEWLASQAYAVGATIVDPAGHLQECVTAGTSGGSAPTFNDAGGTTSDGSVTWQDRGVPGSWAASHAYSAGAAILDSNGHLQVVTTAGTSGSSQPTWNRTGGTTADGTAVWTDQGVPSADTSPGYYFSGAQLGNVVNATMVLNITQVGSTTPGTDLRVYITF